jgi:hypothetical protein
MHLTTSQLHLRYPSLPGFAQPLWRSFLWCRYAIFVHFRVSLLDWKCRTTGFNRKDVFVSWRRFTTRSVHSQAWQFTQITFRLQKCSTKLHSMPRECFRLPSSSLMIDFCPWSQCSPKIWFMFEIPARPWNNKAPIQARRNQCSIGLL